MKQRDKSPTLSVSRGFLESLGENRLLASQASGEAEELRGV